MYKISVMLKKSTLRCSLAMLFTFISFAYSYAGSPYIVLKGADTVQLEMGYTFSEPGYTAYSSKGTIITPSVTRASSKPNSFKITGPALIPGTYKISYDVKDSSGISAPTQYRYIIVLPDTARPNLVVAGPDTTFVLVNKASTGYVTLPPVIESEDLVDGTTLDTITPQTIPVNKIDTVKVVYSTSDSRGNRSMAIRWVIVYDNVAPKIVFPPAHDTAYLGSVYKDSIVVTDNYYTKLKVVKSGQFYSRFPSGKPDTLGKYSIIYTVTDGSGNTATTTRYVTVMDTFKPSLTIVGLPKDTVSLFRTYNDKGVTVSDKFYASSDITITKGGTFYAGFPNGRAIQLGTYTIIYTAKNPSGLIKSTTRLVTVIDTFKPSIKLVGPATDSVQVLTRYADKGATAKDTFYSSSFLKITASGTYLSSFPDYDAKAVGKYTIVYTVTNGAGLKASVTRNIKVIDTVAPVIALKGAQIDTLCQGDTYTDNGYSIADIYYKATDIKVDTLSYYHSQKDTTPGLYYIQFRATNPSGKSSLSPKRTVLLRSRLECKNALTENAALEKALKVYPNPTTGILNIRLDIEEQSQLMNISLTDLMGNVISRVTGSNIQQNIFSMDLSNRPAGMYLLNITIAGAKVIKQVIVEH